MVARGFAVAAAAIVIFRLIATILIGAAIGIIDRMIVRGRPIRAAVVAARIRHGRTDHADREDEADRKGGQHDYFLSHCGVFFGLLLWVSPTGNDVQQPWHLWNLHAALCAEFIKNRKGFRI